jgi:hypothetical protein
VVKSDNAGENSVEILLERFAAREDLINTFVANMEKDNDNQEAISIICEEGNELTLKLASHNESDSKHLRSMFSLINQLTSNF